jgi:hypothetical protein
VVDRMRQKFDIFAEYKLTHGPFSALTERLAFHRGIDKGDSDPDLLFGDESTLIVSPSLWIVRLGAASCSARRPYVARLRM